VVDVFVFMGGDVIATVTIGGEGGSSMSIGDESDRDLKREISPKLRVQQEFGQCVTPGYFLTDIVTSDGPSVVMSDGTVMRRDSDFPGHFSDGVAKVFAEQSDGIYFPGKKGELGHYRFSFGDFIGAVRRICLRQGGDLEEMAMDDEISLKNFKGIISESEFIDGDVNPFAARDLFGGGSVGGVVGDLKREAVGRSEEQNMHDAKLRVGLSGFGYNHFGVSDRALISKEWVYGLDKESVELGEIMSYVARVDAKWRGDRVNASIDAEWVKKDKSDIYLKMVSPRNTFKSNERLEEPVMGVVEMSDIYFDVANKFYGAIGLAKKLAEGRVKEKKERVIMELGLEV
jgi:hypothetical protein